MKTSFQLLNHASLLIDYDGQYLLTDPWYLAPAFGSWLPVPPLSIHPAYIASIPNLTLLVSHGHDDHLDDRFVQLLDSDIVVLTGDFKSPGVTKRLSRCGFDDVRTVGEDGQQVGPFFIRSFRNEGMSLDDSIYTVRTPDSLVVHCNDFWWPFTDHMVAGVAQEVQAVGADNVVFLSQANSASGYPLTYKNFDETQKRDVLAAKVMKMVETGMRNCAAVGGKKYAGYAGFSMAFVKGHPEYGRLSVFPTPDYIRSLADDGLQEKVEVLDLLPGRAFDFATGAVQAARFPAYDVNRVQAKSVAFYENYDHITQCDTYNLTEVVDLPAFRERLNAFLQHFNDFVASKAERSSFNTTVLGKTLRVDVPDLEVSVAVTFGKGLTDPGEFNKRMTVQSATLNKVLVGESWLENLYTGFNAEFERSPEDVYNRDIVTYMVMFSYYYKNRILGEQKPPQ